MLDTCHLLPPGSGLQSDPLLFGVTQALEVLYPLGDDRPGLGELNGRAGEDPSSASFEPLALVSTSGTAARGTGLPAG